MSGRLELTGQGGGPIKTESRGVEFKLAVIGILQEAGMLPAEFDRLLPGVRPELLPAAGDTPPEGHRARGAPEAPHREARVARSARPKRARARGS